MKKSLLAIAVAIVPLLAILAGCAKTPETSPPPRPGEPSQPSKIPAPTSIDFVTVSGIPIQASSPKDVEAGKVAIDFWKPIKIGDSFYVHETDPYRDRLYEFRHLVIKVNPDSPLTEADSLNGVAWRGKVEPIYGAGRVYQRRTAGDNQESVWSQWYDPGVVLGFSHVLVVGGQNGKWTAYHFGATGTIYKQVSPSDIPTDHGSSGQAQTRGD